MVFYATFNIISFISWRQLTFFMSSSVLLGWGSEVSCPWRLPQKKKTDDPVRLKPRTLGLRVKHLTTEPCRTPYNNVKYMVRYLHVYLPVCLHLTTCLLL